MFYPWQKSYPSDIEWNLDIEMQPVYRLFDETVEKFPNNPALDFLGKKYSYKKLSSLVDGLACGLQKMGVEKGTKVGLFLPNSPYFLIAYYAILKTGATVVNFNPLYAEKEVEYQINDSDTEYMITLDLAMLYDKAKLCLGTTDLKKLIICSMASILPFPKNLLFPLVKRKDLADILWDEDHVRFNDLLLTGQKPDLVEIDVKEDVAVLQYTGGTTGVPKGAMLTHQNVYANTCQASAWFAGVKPGEDKMLAVLPFFHVFAMIVCLNLAIKNGMEIIALPRFELDEVLRTISDKKPTLFPAVPAIYSGVIHAKNLNKYDLSSIRYCIAGGAPLPVEVKKTFEDLTGCKLAEGYGLTETSPVACCNPLEGENKEGSIGLPLPGTIVEILEPETENPVKQGEPGEICIRGPQVMKGYYNRADATKKVLNNGLLRTGDIAYMDEGGYCYIIDRIKDLIITNGYNVYPRHVEEAIYKHMDVEECVVGGIPDDRRGELVKAWIKPKKGKTLNTDVMKKFLNDKLSAYEMPRRFEFRDEPLPKTLVGKLSRKDLLEQELKGKENVKS